MKGMVHKENYTDFPYTKYLGLTQSKKSNDKTSNVYRIYQRSRLSKSQIIRELENLLIKLKAEVQER